MILNGSAWNSCENKINPDSKGYVLNAYVRKWSVPYVKTGNAEIFSLECLVLSNIRCQLFNAFFASRYDKFLGINFMQLSPSANLQFLVGDIGHAFNNDIGSFYNHYGKCFDARTVLLCN